MGDAVDAAEADDEVGGFDGDDLAVVETFFEDLECVVVLGRAEDGDEEDVVGDIEVGVAGGAASEYFMVDAVWHGEIDDVEGMAVLIGHGL